ncbi:hypothetical protein BGZ73_001505 [Actinomortierella ambigua]|nr:hypothetical protein BGZ73_001505 [Actinomortierella ambigua]
MAQSKSRASLKRSATNSASPSTTTPSKKRKQDNQDAAQARSTSSPSSSKAKPNKAIPKREPRQAAVASKKRTRGEVKAEPDSEEDEDDENDEDYHGSASQEGEVESEESEEGDGEISSDDDFEDDFRTRTKRSATTSTSAEKKSAPSKGTSSTTAVKSSAPSKAKKGSAASLTASQKAALSKAMSKFKVSSVNIPHPKNGPVADAIQPETLEFMRDIKLNNDREYMMLNQERCDKAKADFMDFIRMVKDGLREADPDVMDQEPKDSMMRIYRDVRFSNDKSPYKSQLAAHFSRGGKKSIAAGYYFSVTSENQSFIGCGVWDPSSAVLARIRNGIVEEEERFREILESDALKQIHHGKSGIDILSQESKLKTGPKGFDKDHSAIEFLKLKNFAIGRHFTDLEVVSPGFLDEVLATFDACVDFVHILNNPPFPIAIMPPAFHVLLLPDVAFLIFEQLSTSNRQRARLVCRTWNGVYDSLKGTSVVWSPKTLDGDGIVRDLEESLFKSPAPLTTVELHLPDYPLGLNSEQRHCLEADQGLLFERAISSLLECQIRRHLETLELSIPHAGSVNLMAVLSSLPQLRTIHLAAMDISTWANCTIEKSEEPLTEDIDSHRKRRCYYRLEHLYVSNYSIEVGELLKVLERCPQLETLQLVGSLTGSWGVSGKSVFSAHCARLRYLHITPSIKESKTMPITRNFQDVIAKLPQLKRLGTVYQPACQDGKPAQTPRIDTLKAIQETMIHLTWLYLAEPSWTPTACESILPFLRDMPHLECFYAPHSFVDMEQLAITKKHRRHVEPWVAHRLRVLDLGFMNSLYGNSTRMHGEHHPALRTRDIFEFIGRTMPNLVHLRLRVFSGITVVHNGGTHYLSWLEKLETLMLAMRTTAAPVNEWKVGMFEWLGQPPTPTPEPGSVFYTGARKPKSRVTAKVKSWLLPSTGDKENSEEESCVATDLYPTYDCALPNLRRLHVHRYEASQGDMSSEELEREAGEVEKYLKELRHGDAMEIAVESRRWDKCSMLFHMSHSNVLVRREDYDE